MATPSSVTEYIGGFPPERQAVLQSIREAIHRGAPGADEKIRYGMPAVMLGGRYAIHFAGWKNHIGLYPVPRFDDALESEVAIHRSEKDSVTFPWADPVPIELIERVAAEIARMRATTALD
jgi:uncharacterized protein YdhG (YjbR/CyaY superfamily)